MEGLIFGILRYMTEGSLCPEGVLPIMPIQGGSSRKGYHFQASGIRKGRNCSRLGV